jgi:hypothetical protein
MRQHFSSWILVLAAIVGVATACTDDGAAPSSATGNTSTSTSASGGSAQSGGGGSTTSASGGAGQAGNPSGGSGGQAGALTNCADATITPGAYYVDVDDLSGSADDANDGKLVSEGGTGPWRTWAKLAAMLDSNTFSAGDWIYLRGGTYVPTSTLFVTGAGGAAQSQKITISGYPGETATIDLSVTGDHNMLAPASGYGPIHHDGGNVRWQNLNLHSDGLGFSAANAHGLEFVCMKQTWSGTPSGAGNGGVLDFQYSNDFLVEGCDIEGSAGANANSGAVYLIYVSSGVVRNNILRMTGLGQVIHIKKNGVVAAPGDIVVENNLIVMLGEPSRGTFSGGNSRFLIRNNIFAFEHDHSPWFLPSDSGGNMSPVSAENIVEHNTFYSKANTGIFDINRQGAGTWPTSGEGNVLTDNVFTGWLNIFQYDSGSHNTTTDYNLYRPGNQAVREYGTAYDLAGWQAHYGQDAHSLAGTPIFASMPNLDDPLSFALDPSSPGYQAASDGKDMGADVSLVGPAGM